MADENAISLDSEDEATAGPVVEPRAAATADGQVGNCTVHPGNSLCSTYEKHSWDLIVCYCVKLVYSARPMLVQNGM
jgi:hypothetical protein